jgi:PAS domain S-box-containing protein
VARSAAERRRGIGLPSTYARLQALYEMGQRVGRAERAEDAYDAAIDGLIAVLGADRASILRFDEAGVMRFVAWHGISDEYRAAVEGHTPWTPKEADARPIIVPDVATDPSLAGIRDTILDEGIRACAFVPLLHAGRVVGKFMLYYDDPHDFAGDELVLAQAMATQIAGASERRRAEDMLRSQRDQYQQILSGVSDGITMLDAEGSLVYANEAAVELIGVPLDELLVQPAGSIMARFDMIDELGRPLEAKDAPSSALFAGRSAEPRLIGFTRKEQPGSIRWSLVDAVPIRRADGTLDGVLTVFRDVTEERAGETRMRLLAEAGRILGSSLDYEVTLQSLADLTVPELAELCIVHVVDEEGRLRRVASAAVDDELAERSRRFEERWPPVEGAPGQPAVLESGASFLQPELESVLARPDVPPGLVADVRELGMRGFLLVPLVARSHTLGVLTLAVTDRTSRVLDERDLELSEELGRRAGIAIENAQLFRRSEASLAVLNTLLESTPIGLGFFNRDLRYLHVNDALAEVNGIAASEHIGRAVSEVVPGLAARLEPILRGVLESGEPVENLEFSGESPARPGDARNWLVGYYPVRDVGGDVIGVAGVVQDVTGRKAAEEERSDLLERERQARLTLERLGRVTEVALAHLTLEDLLGELMRAIVDVLEADTGAILLREDEVLVVRASIGFDRTPGRAVGIPIGAGIAGSVAASRQSLIVEDLDEAELASPALRERGIHSLVAIPLIVADDVIGVVHVGAEQPRKFGADDARLLQLLADRIGLAINQSRLFEAERMSRDRLAFLAEASEVVGSSLDYETALARVAELAVPKIADWCAVDIVADDGQIERLAVVHSDPAKSALAHELQERFRPNPNALTGVSAVIRTGAPELIPQVTEEMLAGALEGAEAGLVDLAGDLGLVSAMTLPLIARGRMLGAITFVAAESGRRYTDADLELGMELARRAAVGVDNARLFREAEERGQAARVLAAVGDGVFLVDGNDVVRYWNHAAELLTGLQAAEVVGRGVAEVIPGWTEIESRVPRATGGASAVAQTLPLALGDRELWLSISGVGFEDGTVYAFRDLTEERVLEQMRSEFVSTVSHELRTPLAAIYGAAMTLQRPDMTLGEVQRESLLGVIAGEADRLARTVNDILWAARIDTHQVRIALESCDAARLTETVVRAQRAHLPANVQVELRIPDGLAPVAADPDKVRQVLVNVVENAVKYSPDGGTVQVALASRGSMVRFSISDEGLGIPAAEQRRIFEKFYRLDPQMTRGVGGTGLGLYICRELVRRMTGRIWVESEPGRGSTFHVELPVAGTDADITAHLA